MESIMWICLLCLLYSRRTDMCSELQCKDWASLNPEVKKFLTHRNKQTAWWAILWRLTVSLPWCASYTLWQHTSLCSTVKTITSWSAKGQVLTLTKAKPLFPFFQFVSFLPSSFHLVLERYIYYSLACCFRMRALQLSQFLLVRCQDSFYCSEFSQHIVTYMKIYAIEHFTE